MKNLQLNPYKITWAIITPIKGKFTQKDFSLLKKTMPSLCGNDYLNERCAHFPTKERAIEVLAKSKASKEYKVVFITDKQFGMTNNSESLLKVATTLQINSQTTI